MDTHYPRVLIIGTPINQTAGSSITVGNLFHDWPEEQLATIHNMLHGNDPGRAREFRLRMEMVLPMMRLGVEWKTREQMASVSNGLLRKGRMISGHPSIHRDLLRKLVETLGISGIIRRFPLTRDLVNFINEFKPDVAYSQLGDISIATLLLDIKAHFGIPHVVHIMDDYPATLHRRGIFSKIVRRKLNNQLRRIFDQAGICMGISEAMCEEYSVRYGREFAPFHNVVDMAIWDNNSVANHDDKHLMTLVYAGRIGVSCLTSVMDIYNAVRDWKHSDVLINFDMYVNNLGQALSVAPFLERTHPRIRVREAPKKPEDIAAILKAADILVIPVDFDQDSIAYIRYSMPTKIPAYMAAGVPILVYGPPGVASVEYAKTQGWACVIDERSSKKLSDGILCLCVDKELRNLLSHRARHLASLNHDAAVVRNRFRDTMTSVAATGKGS